MQFFRINLLLFITFIFFNCTTIGDIELDESVDSEAISSEVVTENRVSSNTKIESSSSKTNQEPSIPSSENLSSTPNVESSYSVEESSVSESSNDEPSSETPSSETQSSVEVSSVEVSSEEISSEASVSSSLAEQSSSNSLSSQTQSDDSDFTIVVLPDTQYYTTSNPEIFPIQLQWVADNVSVWNMAFVSHVGDVVDNADRPEHWEIGTSNMFKLDGKVPYGIAGGNHDSNGSGSGIYTSFNEQFPDSKYQSYSWYGGSHSEGYAYGNYEIFSAGGMQFIAVHIPYKHTTDIRAWASSIFAQYPNHRGILTTHEYMYTGVQLGTGGGAIWDEVINPNPNVFMAQCGHYGTTRENFFITENDAGKPVIQILSDYQKDPNGGNGWLRLYKFKPTANLIEVYTYSPFLEQYETDADSRFDIPYTMQ